jgi:uncharacterized Tic20 family protein
MAELDTLTPTQDERVMAALAHVSTLLPMMGMLASMLIWITQKDKSKYVGFQALQALAFELTRMLILFVGMGCYMVSFFGMIFSTPLLGLSENPDAVWPFMGFFFIPFVSIAAIFALSFLFIGYGIIGAVMTFQGKPFRYVILGRAIEHYMEPKPAAVPGG